MADRIKGITVVIGGDTTGLSKALEGVNKEIRSTQWQLKDVERLLKLDPTNTKLLEQRQRLLSDAVQETKTKLDTLKTAEKQVQQQFAEGKVSQQQYDALQREIVATSADLKRLEEQAKKSNSVLSGISAGAGKVSDGASSIAKAFAPATAAVGGLATAAYATIPATAELRSDLSKLDTNAEENAVSADAAREAWRAFAVQSGETDSAVEATSNLLQAGFTESNLQKAVEGLSGAAQRFPDTLKIESLADSLQETLATGNATGQFGELLDRLGIGAENFSAQLADCATDAEKQNLALQTLADAGLNDTYNAWAKNNEEMLANDEANLKLQESMASLAETILPLVTLVTEKISELIAWFANLDKSTQTAIFTALALVAAISPIAGIVSGVSGVISQFATTGLPLMKTAFSTLSTSVLPAVSGALKGIAGTITGVLSSAFSFLTTTVLPAIGTAFSAVFSFIAANPIVLLIAAIVGLVALIVTKGQEIIGVLQGVDDFLQNVFAVDWTNIFGPRLGSVLNVFFANVSNIWSGIKQILEGVLNFIQGVFTGNWQQAWEGVKQIFKGVWDGFVGIAKVPINAIIGLINGLIGAINMAIGGLNSLKISVPDWIPGIGGKSFGFNIPSIPSIPYLAKGGTVLSGSAIVGEAGPELLTVGPGGTRVQPLTNSGGAAKGGAVVSIENVTFYGYTPQQGRALVRDLNRQLGGLYA